MYTRPTTYKGGPYPQLNTRRGLLLTPTFNDQPKMDEHYNQADTRMNYPWVNHPPPWNNYHPNPWGQQHYNLEGGVYNQYSLQHRTQPGFQQQYQPFGGFYKNLRPVQNFNQQTRTQEPYYGEEHYQPLQQQQRQDAQQRNYTSNKPTESTNIHRRPNEFQQATTRYKETLRNANVPNLPNDNRLGYSTLNPENTLTIVCLEKSIFLIVQLKHHLNNWLEIPFSLAKKIENFFLDLKPPKNEDSDFTHSKTALSDKIKSEMMVLIVHHLENKLAEAIKTTPKKFTNEQLEIATNKAKDHLKTNFN